MKSLRLFGFTVACVVLFNFAANAQDENIDKLNKGIDLYTQAAEAYKADQYDQAIQYCNDAYTIATEVGEIGTELKGNLVKLIPQLYYKKASKLLSNNDFIPAEAALAQAKEVADKFNATDVQNNIKEALPKLYMAVAQGSLETGSHDSVVMYVKKAIALDPNNPTAYLIEGYSYLRNKDFDNAELTLNKCIEVAKAAGDESTAKSATSQLSSVSLAKANAAFSAKKYSEAYTLAEKSLGYAESVNGLKIKAMSATQLKKWDAVISAYTNLAALDEKEKPGANYGMATAYYNKGDKAKACENFKKVVNEPKFKKSAEQFIKALNCR